MTRPLPAVCRLLPLFSLAAVLSGTPAWAQGSPHPATDYAEQRTEAGTAVIFKDDLMSGAGGGPSGDIFVGRRSPARSLLLRPRYQFVSEMLKSVENL